MMAQDGQARIAGLEQLIKEASASPDAPVERWNPPYCGDIGLAIRANGDWEYQASPIRRPALVKLFARVLRRDEDGRHYLVTPAEKVDVKVIDAPFLAVEMEVRGRNCDQVLTFRTNVDDVIVCSATHPLRFARDPAQGGMKPYLLVRGRLEALLTRSVTYDLLELASPAPVEGQWEIVSKGARFVFEAGQ